MYILRDVPFNVIIRLSGRRMFFEGQSINVLDLNIECIFNASIDEIECSIALDLLKNMLIIDPNQRITVENALGHKFFHFLEELESKSPSIN